MTINTQEQPKSHSKSLEFTIFLLFLLGPLTGNIINVLFGVLSLDFQVSPDNILNAIPAFMFPFAITQLFSGAISDIKGRIPVLIVGLILFAIAMLTAGLSFNLEMYIIANIIGGIGFGFINPVLIALMTDITSPANIPKKLGYLGASANLGVGIGPLIASQMILIGWQSIYVLFIIITCFCFIYFIKAKRPPQIIPDKSGIRIVFAQLSKEWRRFPVILMILSAFLIAHTYLAINIWTSKTLAQTHVINETLIGIVLGLAGVGAAITGLITGNLIKKKGVRIPLLIGSLILLCSLAILLVIGDINNPEKFTFLALGWILAGFSGGILFTTLTYYSQVLSPERRGVLAGLLTAGYFTGIALVPTTLAPFFNIFNITGVYIVILLVSVIFIIIMVLLYIFAKSVILEKGKLHTETKPS
ncbi:MAG: MFS transporter [Candidatus Hodarchaeota archaeon]